MGASSTPSDGVPPRPGRRGAVLAIECKRLRATGGAAISQDYKMIRGQCRLLRCCRERLPLRSGTRAPHLSAVQASKVSRPVKPLPSRLAGISAALGPRSSRREGKHRITLSDKKPLRLHNVAKVILLSYLGQNNNKASRFRSFQ